MKTLIITISMIVALGAGAQPGDSNKSIETRRGQNKSAVNAATTTPPVEKDFSRVVGQRFTYSGIAVQAAQTDNLLQLINPLAPPEYGSGAQNAVREPRTGNVVGWKFLSLDF